MIDTLLRAKVTEAAKLLVLTSAPIAKIASELGFGSPYYFSAQFRRRYALSPRAFRRALSGSGELD